MVNFVDFAISMASSGSVGSMIGLMIGFSGAVNAQIMKTTMASRMIRHCTALGCECSNPQYSLVPNCHNNLQFLIIIAQSYFSLL